MSNWLEFLRKVISSPFVQSTFLPQIDFSWKYYLLSSKNKIPLTYLSKVKSNSKIYLSLYNYHRKRYCRMIEIICEISKIMERNNLEYAIIKTLRPYPEDAADVDILIFGDEKDYYKSIKILSKVFKPLDLSWEKSEIGFYDYKSFKILPYAGYRYRDNIKLDIHKELAVLNLIYVDKNSIRAYVKDVRVSNGEEVKVLAPPAELLVDIAHTMIKECSFSLADYLTTLHYLAQMNDSEMSEFISLVIENRLMSSFDLHMSLVAAIHLLAHRFIPEKIYKLSRELNNTPSIPKKFIVIITKYEPPYKIGIIERLRIYSEKLQCSAFRRNLPITIFKTIRRRMIANEILKNLLTLNI
jgi:hypothetical protein